MNDFDGYGEENPLKADTGWLNETGFGHGSAPGGGDQWGAGFKTFSAYYDELPDFSKPSLGKFLIYVFCITVLLLGLWII